MSENDVPLLLSFWKKRFALFTESHFHISVSAISFPKSVLLPQIRKDNWRSQWRKSRYLHIEHSPDLLSL